MTPLSQARNRLAALLREQLPVTVWASIPETLTPPLVAVTAAAEWIARSERWSAWQVRLSVMVAVPLTTNSAALDAVENLTLAAVSVLEGADDWWVNDVEAPTLIIQGDQVALASQINVSTTIELN
jgi:hypothetical protein